MAVPRPHENETRRQSLVHNLWRTILILTSLKSCEPFSATPSNHPLAPSLPSPPPFLSSNTPRVEILHLDSDCAVVSKPPSVICHHAPGYSRPDEIPMLQRTRETLNGTHVNLVHRLDRGASGCLITAFSGDATTRLATALQSPLAAKTYVAIVRGTGELRGEDLRDAGWFTVDRPIKNEKGASNEAVTEFRFVCGRFDERTGARASLVLARPSTGRWHQIRRHLNGLSHPIIGDTTHGSSETNKMWRRDFDLPSERLCLHLGRVRLPEMDGVGGLDVTCPLAMDMVRMLRRHLPEVLEGSRKILEEEGIVIPEEVEEEGGDAIEESTQIATNLNGETNIDSPAAEILDIGPNYVVASKPPGIVCHNSKWTKSEEYMIPMLQRVRDTISSGYTYHAQKRVNLIHRLDQSASGCLLFSVVRDLNKDGSYDTTGKAVTSTLIEALQSPQATKTYMAITVGDSINPDEEDGLLKRGWFQQDRPVKDENGNLKSANTQLRFIAGNDRGSVVLARPSTGRYHQIRQHLRQIYHPILGCTTHGYNRTNREWKKERGMPPRRTFLHLARIQLPPTAFSNAIDVSCPVPTDMRDLLEKHLPSLLDETIAALKKEGMDVL